MAEAERGRYLWLGSPLDKPVTQGMYEDLAVPADRVALCGCAVMEFCIECGRHRCGMRLSTDARWFCPACYELRCLYQCDYGHSTDHELRRWNVGEMHGSIVCCYQHYLGEAARVRRYGAEPPVWEELPLAA